MDKKSLLDAFLGSFETVADVQRVVNKDSLYSIVASFLHHTGKAAIKNVNTIDERRSNIVRNSVFDCHLSPNWRGVNISNVIQ